MIVDCHTHYAGEWYSHLRPGSLIDSMDRYGIDHSVVFTLDGLFADFRHHNDELASYVSGHRERLTGFCTVNPRDPAAADEVYRAVGQFGFRGLKLHPWVQGFSPLEAYMEPVARACADLGIPIIFHDGTPPYSTPLQVATVAERHPDLRVILGHSGLLDLWPEALDAGRRLDNVFLCLCGPPTSAMQMLVDAVPHERILFGSDTGFGADYQTHHRLEQVRTLQLPSSSLDAILGGNAVRLLGIDSVSQA